MVNTPPTTAPDPDLLGGGDPFAGLTQGSTTGPIGIPAQGYVPGNMSTTPGHTPSGNQQATQYMPGDEWAPGSADPAAIQGIQAQLVKAGLIDVKDIRPGVWDAKAASAYRTVLAFANAHGQTAHIALMNLMNNPKIGSASGSGSGAPYPVDNPLDIKAAVQAQANELIGGGMSAAQQMKATQFVQGLENQGANAYDAAAQKSAKGDRATYTDKPSASAAARQYILDNNQADIKSYQTAYNALHFADMLKAL